MKNIQKIERRRKKFNRSIKLRKRNMCPNCNSLDVAKRSTTSDYKCYNCKWVGKNIEKIMY